MADQAKIDQYIRELKAARHDRAAFPQVMARLRADKAMTKEAVGSVANEVFGKSVKGSKAEYLSRLDRVHAGALDFQAKASAQSTQAAPNGSDKFAAKPIPREHADRLRQMVAETGPKPAAGLSTRTKVGIGVGLLTAAGGLLYASRAKAEEASKTSGASARIPAGHFVPTIDTHATREGAAVVHDSFGDPDEGAGPRSAGNRFRNDWQNPAAKAIADVAARVQHGAGHVLGVAFAAPDFLRHLLLAQGLRPLVNQQQQHLKGLGRLCTRPVELRGEVVHPAFAQP